MKKFIDLIKEEDIFVPRNIEGRKEKIKQALLKQLDQKVIDGDVEIDCKLIPDNYIAKVELINGDVHVKKCNSLKFFKQLKEVNGSFVCEGNKLTSLEGCPEIVQDNFWCNHNYLTSLKYCPKTVNGSFSCYNNKVELTVKDVEEYCDVKYNVLTHTI